MLILIHDEENPEKYYLKHTIMLRKIIIVAVLLLSISLFGQKNTDLKINKINKSGYLDYGVIEYNNNTYIRNGYVFIVKSEGKKVGKIVVDSVTIGRAYGFLDLNPEISDKNKLIANNKLILYRSYYLGIQYAYELSLSDRNDKFQQLSLGLDFYPSFSKFRKNTNIWIGADVGFLFGELFDHENDDLYSNLLHAFVRFEIGHSPFYETKTHRGLIYGASIRPHQVKFLVADYYGFAEDHSTDAYIFISNFANFFLGYQVAFFELRAELSINQMKVDTKNIEDMNSVYLRAAFNF